MTSSKTSAVTWMAVAYLCALGIAALVLVLLQGQHPLLAVGLADISGTVVIFGFSRWFNNSSFYDPYWSVAPFFIALAFFFLSPIEQLNPRQWIVLVLVLVWGARLTFNFLRGFKGLHHQDWRYDDLQSKHGRWYWWVSFSGIHLMPTVLVYLACASLYIVFSNLGNALCWMDIFAGLFTLAAILLEAIADEQLFSYKKAAPPPGTTFQNGLWSIWRHPNYVGETAFWWGLFFFSWAAMPVWWPVIGPIAITLLFRYISIPMIEKRMLARRKDYPEYLKKVPAYFFRVR